MDENLHNQESSQTSAPTGQPRGIDINRLFLPGAILLAGIMVSGTLLYTNLGRAQLPGGAEGETITAENLKKWAKELKLNTGDFNNCLDSGRHKAEIAKDLEDGSKAGVEGTPTFFINGTKVVGAQPYEVLKNAIDQAVAKKNIAAASAPTIDDDPVLGDANAPVTIIEFSDYQCPFCKRFWNDTLESIKKDYVDTGVAKFVYRDFPLSIHPGAEPAAEAANCAGEQGKYWEMHDLIFEKQG